MIDSIKQGQLRNGEFIQFITDGLAIVLLNNPKTLLVQDKYDAVSTARNTLFDIFKSSQGNPITPEVEALDLRRDKALIGFSTVVTGFTYSPDAIIGMHADVLSNYLQRHGTASTVAVDNYQSETNTLTSIVNDCRTRPELVTAVALLQAGSWLTEIEAANTAFNALYLKRTQSIGSETSDNFKTQRLLASNAWTKLRNYLDAQFIINEGAEPFNQAINEINALIGQYNNLLAGRAKPKSSDETKDLDVATPVTPEQSLT